MARATDPVAARAAAVKVVAALREGGRVAYFAGGCVRDELLGLHPTDYDVATDAEPGLIRSLFLRTYHVGAAFGVVLVQMKQATIEVATFRAEGPYTDKRRPDSVRYTTPEEDARRRDFTINALFLDPLEAPADDDQPPAAAESPAPLDVRGRVIDFVGGREDLRRRVLRAVGDPDARLDEDHLRALRAVRFTARLGFSLDPATGEAIRRHARELRGVSRERIGEELRRMLEHPRRADAAALIQQLGLDEPALAEPPAAGHTPAALTCLRALPADARMPAALAAWAIDRHAAAGVLDEPGALAVARRWRGSMCLSNAERDGLIETLDLHHILATQWDQCAVARRKRLAGRRHFRPMLPILEATHPDTALTVRADLAACGVDLSKPPPEPLVTGDDLIDAGMRAGPHFKRILAEVYDAQLEGRIETLAQGLELARTVRG